MASPTLSPPTSDYTPQGPTPMNLPPLRASDSQYPSPRSRTCPEQSGV